MKILKNILPYLFPVFLILAWSLIITFELDNNCNNSRVFNYVMYSSDSTISLPPHWGLGYDGKRYIVTDTTDLGIKYLTTNQWEIACFWPDTQPPATFADSAAAKGYFRVYWFADTVTARPFKPVKR